ncbi:type II secretion system protein GspD [Comamonadaceae bacterium OH2545_COT-014]|nr:type II secretion system protein GspD [Comamonadaceae bacterium OH2545_COT-014]
MLAPAKGGGVIKGPVSNFKFEDAPVGEVVHVMLRDLLKVDYVVHPPLKGSVTLVTRGNVSADKAMLLLESALQLNGIVMARDSRGTYHVGTPESLRGIVAAPRQAGGGTLPPGYGAVVIPLQYLGAAEMAGILQPMVSPDAIVRVDTLRNILIMRGTRAEAEGWLDLVNTFDVNLLRGMSVGVFPLKHTSAAEVEAALRLLSGGAAGAAAAGGRAPAAGAAGQAAGRAPAGAAQGAAGLGVGGSALGEGSPLFGALRVMPIERLNAVLVVTPRAAYLDEVRYWIEQFDRPNLNSAEPQLFVYKVKNGSADHLAELLNGIYGGVMAGPSATGATGVAPGLNTAVGATTGGAAGALRGGARGLGASMGAGGFGGLSSGVGGLNSGGAGLLGGAAAGQAPVAGAGAQPAQSGPAVTTVTLGQSVRVMADRINNTLLIHATPAEYGRIEATLKRLDIQRAQVLIEASIIEVALRDGLEYGLQWAFKNGVGSRNGLGVLNNGSGSAVAGAAIDAAGAITNAAQGFSYTLTGAAGNLSAMLNALATKSLVKVISSPSLMVLDNHSASIVVGDQQPINVGTTISSTGTIATTNNIQYKDTGVMLNVTPSVNAGDLVTLDINQTVTDVGLKDDVTNQRSFLQRQINSKVAVRSGETLVLGGLIKDNQDNGKSGLPGLSSIPVLGALFGKHNQSSARTELLVVLTPRVLRSDEDARAISRELRDRMRGLSAESRP